MKTILNLKQGDLLIQALALFIPLVICFISRSTEPLVLAYFTVGGTQIISCLANIGLPSKLRSDRRKYYERTLGLLTLFILVISLILLQIVWITGLMLLIVSPFLAIWYALICYDELCTIQRYADRKKYVLTN